MWHRIAKEQHLPLRTGEDLAAVKRQDETYIVSTTKGRYRARYVCLALGRRGTPRKLAVPGEDLPKVTYSLLDAASYQNRRVLVVGGGDSAVEAAIGLSEQPGNEVTLSYRGKTFSRIKSRNEARLHAALQARKVQLLLESQVTHIEPDRVALVTGADKARLVLPNDDVFVFAGGVPPFALLEATGVSFDPEDRPSPESASQQGSNLSRSMLVAGLVALLVLAFTLYHRDYYRMAPAGRPISPKHDSLSPTSAFGMMLGVLAVLAMLANLAYLLRRSRLGARLKGSLRAWMSAHVVTGIVALLCALLHAGMWPRHSAGGHALWAMVVVVVAGAIGRWLYSLLPRAANGQELKLDQVQHQLAAITQEWEVERDGFGSLARERIRELVQTERFGRGFVGRLAGIVSSRLRLRRTLLQLAHDGQQRGVPREQLVSTLALARRAHRVSLASARYEDLRGVLASWRWLHRWVALLLVLVLAIHIVTALRYARLPWLPGVTR
jgi:hypothetical protein